MSSVQAERGGNTKKMTSDTLDKEWTKLVDEQSRLSTTCICLGKILKEHSELTGCIQAIGIHIFDTMTQNEKRIGEISKRVLEKMKI